MNFHEAKMGHSFFEHQVPQLIKAVNALTAALSKPAPAVDLPVSPDPKFLDSLFFGRYQPEVYEVSSEGRRLNHAINLAHKALMETLPEHCRERLEAYEAALSERNTAVAELAYESGVRVAVQMIMSGLSRPATEVKEEVR